MKLLHTLLIPLYPTMKLDSLDSLKHGVAIRPKESEMIVIMEDIHDQIMRQNVVRVIFQKNDLKLP